MFYSTNQSYHWILNQWDDRIQCFLQPMKIGWLLLRPRPNNIYGDRIIIGILSFWQTMTMFTCERFGKEFTEKRNLTRHMKTHQEKSRVAANTEVLPDDPEIRVLYLRHWDRGSDRQPCPWPVQLYPAWDDAVHYLEHNIYTSLDVHLGANMFVTAESPALHLDIRHYYWINDKRHPSMDNKVTGEE